MSGILNVHSTNSLKQSAVKVQDICARAKELGLTAVALADHGVMTGIPSFSKAAQKAGIKPVFGVTLLVKGNTYESNLVIYAKNMNGYNALIKAMKMTNDNMRSSGLEYPFADADTLNQCFGLGSIGYNNVYAVSSGMQGVIQGMALQNNNYQEKLSELKVRLSKAEQAKSVLIANQQRLEQVETEIKEAEKISKQNISQLRKEVEKAKDGMFYYEKKAELDEAEAAIATAKEQIKFLKADKAAINKQITINKKNIPDSVADEEEFNRVSALVMNRDQLITSMEAACAWYEKLFGKGNFYLELQYHGAPLEKEWMPIIDLVADRSNIPTSASTRAYMAGCTEADITGYETMLSLSDEGDNVKKGFKKLNSYQKKHYMMGNDELSAQLKKIIAPSRVAFALSGNDTILDNCNVTLEKQHHYPVFDRTKDAYELLCNEIQLGIKNRFPDGFPDDRYEDRWKYELSVMKQMDVCDYHLIVQDLTRFGRKLGHMPEARYQYLKEHIIDMEYQNILNYVDADQSRVGYTVGPGRGSSAGSLICYLIGITDIDPLKYDLLFERFLNPERATMPDIDMDFANGYRDVIVWYTYKRYGMEAVCRIITFSTLKPKAAIKDVARQMDDNKAGEILSGDVSPKPGTTFADAMDALGKHTTGNRKYQEIVDRSASIENSYRHYSMHAAGVVISDNDDVSQYLPLMWDIDNKQWKSQYNMTEVEEFGLLKMDYLGLKNLNMITEMLRLVYDRRGIAIDPTTDIQEEKEVIKAICATGKTNSVFQLESAGMKDTVRKLQPDCFEDLILLVAAYRPGPMDSIPQMISVKHGGAPSYRHPMLEPILNVTYGSLIYQEQVQQVFRQLAGYSYGRADLVRRAMSKKKEKEFLAEKPVFIHGDKDAGIVGCVGNGIPEDVAGQIFDDMVSFAAYAFNKSHAAAYARITYMLAWFKYHYPIEFYTVALGWANDTQKVALVGECKENNISVKPVDINASEEGFSVDDNAIRFGITSVKGIGNAGKIVAERKKKPYESFQDFLLRSEAKKTAVEGLIKVGAFDQFCKNRKAVLLAYDEMAGVLKTIGKLKKDKAETQNILSALEQIDNEKDTVDNFNDIYVMNKLKEAGYKKKTIPTKDSLLKKLRIIEEDLADALEELNDIEFPVNIEDDEEEKFWNEKQLTGVFISGHPMDAYQLPDGNTQITNLVKDTVSQICGVITNLKVRISRKNNAEMAFFDLEDKSGIIHVSCFASPYSRYGKLLEEGHVIGVKGKTAVKETISEDDEVKEVLEIILFEASELHHSSKRVILQIPCIVDWNEIYHEVQPFVAEDGEYFLWLHDAVMNELRNTGLHVRPGIMKLPGAILA